MADARSSWIVEPAEAGQRVDKLVATRTSASRAVVRRLMEQGAVRVDGRRAKKGERLVAGQSVELTAAPPTAADLSPTPEPAATLEVLYEDGDLVAVNKPANVPSHPLRPGERGTLAGALIARFPECAAASLDPREGGLVHRLDTGTTGILVAARTRAAWQACRKRFGAGEVQKGYLALVAGEPLLDQGTISAPLATRGTRAVVDAGGLDASTEWSVVRRFRRAGLTLLRAVARTGRMHQVRAHLAYAELPIVGDTHYGGPARPELAGHFLHAERLRLPHPRTNVSLEIEAPLPADRKALLDALSHAA